MHILFTRFPLESRFGGAEVQTLNLMKGFIDRGLTVSFVGSCPTLLQEVLDRRLAMSSKKLEIGRPPVTKWLAISFALRGLRMQRRLKRTLKEMLAEHNSPINTIIMLSLTEKLLLTEWCCELGIKVLWVEHDRIGRWLTWNPWLPLLRRLSALATTVCVSNLSAALYQKLGWKGKIIAIPNGIDCAEFESEKIIDATSSIFRIGCCARLTQDKGIDVLIEALKNIPNIHLTIVGTGREEKTIQALLKKTLGTANTELRTSVVDMIEFYNSIDLFVLPSSDHDPFGLVVAEAMAAGVPTICTSACGIASHLSPDEGMVVAAGDSEELQTAILRMRDPLLRSAFSERGRNAAQKKFSFERMVNDYAKLL